MMSLLLALLLTAIAGGASAAPSAAVQLGCRDQNNNLVDWYVLYKLPILTYAQGFARNGSAYLHFSSASTEGQWSLSEVAIDDPASPPGLTLTPVYDAPERDDLQYVFYNDEWPDGSSSSTKGHTKGAVAFAGDQGFWMIHSVPKFPPAPGEGRQYSYASNGYTYGQSFLCITFPTSELDKVAKQVTLNEPFTYASKDFIYHPLKLPVVDERHPAPSQQHASVPENRSLNGREPAEFAGATSNIEVISSSYGSLFTSFAKSRDYGADLYSGLVAPRLSAGLYAETWRASLPSDCSGSYQVENVRNVTASTAQQAFDFGSTKDHSKWAVSSSAARPWVCVGDINRAETQQKRGGGTACLEHAGLWSIYSQMVTVWEACA